MHPKLLYLFFLFFTALFLGSCSNTRFLTGDALLYTGKNKVSITGPEKYRNRKKAEQVIQSVSSYKPNNAIGGKRMLPPLGLWIYNYSKPKGNNKLSAWYYKTFSSEPVLISQVNPELRSKKLESELFNIGFFHATVSSSIDTSLRNKRKAKISYKVTLDYPFEYDSVSFVPPLNALDSVINNYGKDLKIKAGDVFDLETVKSETRKIAGRATEKGYYYFNSGYVQWTADTTQVPGRIWLRIGRNKEIMQDAAAKKYSIGSVSVRLMNVLDSTRQRSAEDTILNHGINIISRGMDLKPEVISRSIYFKPGELYASSKHQQTVQRLNSYGVFKFINLQYFPSVDSVANILDLSVELSLMKEVSLDLEANVVTKSTGFSGPGFVATLAHRNLGHGANKLQLKMDGGLEWQWGSSSSSSLGTVSYNVGLSSSIVFPRIIKPFNLFSTSRFSLPQTTITAGFEFLNKIQYYRMNSLNLGLGYQWRKSERITHIFYPLYFNTITLLQTTTEFDSILNANPYIRKSFEEQFIAGMKYDFIYDNSSSRQPNGFYFQGGISSSGNLVDLIKRATIEGEDRPYTTIGNVYSQFLKFTTDIRYYRNTLNHSLAFRFYAGLGVPYSNSVVMPYVEQFYSGGSNSIRAFVARSLGPGGFYADNTSDIIDQTGDIRLEGNVEYRFALSKIMKGAFFLDAGNVWLLNNDESRPDAEFKFNTFASQLAVGTGFGLRFDFSFFILRTDIGLPLRHAYATGGKYWLPSVKDVFEGFLFNLAIGYPF